MNPKHELERICNKCGKKKPISEYYLKKGGTMEHSNIKSELSRMLPKKMKDKRAKAYTIFSKGYNCFISASLDALCKRVVGEKEIIKAMDSREDYIGFEAGYNGKPDKLCLGEILTGANIDKIAQVLDKEFLILKREGKC